MPKSKAMQEMWKNEAKEKHKAPQQQQQQHNKNLVSSLKWWVLFAIYEQFVLSYYYDKQVHA